MPCRRLSMPTLHSNGSNLKPSPPKTSCRCWPMRFIEGTRVIFRVTSCIWNDLPPAECEANQSFHTVSPHSLPPLRCCSRTLRHCQTSHDPPPLHRDAHRTPCPHPQAPHHACTATRHGTRTLPVAVVAAIPCRCRGARCPGRRKQGGRCLEVGRLKAETLAVGDCTVTAPGVHRVQGWEVPGQACRSGGNVRRRAGCLDRVREGQQRTRAVLAARVHWEDGLHRVRVCMVPDWQGPAHPVGAGCRRLGRVPLAEVSVRRPCTNRVGLPVPFPPRFEPMEPRQRKTWGIFLASLRWGCKDGVHNGVDI
eukprot:m.92654 g.92654  ORF g.92654 m.92654 type:complete len:308 (-) comp9967_c0_seq1:114-1037(-)